MHVRSTRAIEWPTVAILGGCYAAFAIVTLFWESLPIWALPFIGGYIVALHGGLQHEIIHGHPTRSALINEWLVFPSLLLWVPYRRYRSQHLVHHNNERLTDPFADPESFYFDPTRWQGLPVPVKALLRFNNTLLGRLTIGASINVARFWWCEASLVRHGNGKIAADWLAHVPAAALVVLWLVMVCDMPLWIYGLCFAYPGTSLILLRSYAEHRAHEDATARTLVLETNRALALLFLNNNLHSAHHERPDLAWYLLPAYYVQNKKRLLAANQNYFIDGYSKLIGAHLLRAKEPVAHPIMRLPPPDSTVPR